MALEPAIVYKTEMHIDIPNIQNDPRIPGMIEKVEKARADDIELDYEFRERGWTNRAYVLGILVEVDLEKREDEQA